MVKSLQDFSLHEDVIDVSCRPNDFGFYGLDGNLLLSDAVFGQNDLPKASLTKFLQYVVLAEATTRVKVISFTRIQRGLILNVFEIVIGKLTSLAVEQSQLAIANLPADIGNRGLLATELELQQQLTL